MLGAAWHCGGRGLPSGAARFDLGAVGARLTNTWERARDADVARRLTTTPGRLRLMSIALVVGLAGMWTVGAIALTTVHGAAHDIGLEQAPLLVDAGNLYGALADADAGSQHHDPRASAQR